MRTIIYRDQSEPIINKLDVKLDSEKNMLMIKAVEDTIAPQVQQITSIAASQNNIFRTHSEALQMLIQSRPSPKSVPPQNLECPVA